MTNDGDDSDDDIAGMYRDGEVSDTADSSDTDQSTAADTGEPDESPDEDESAEPTADAPEETDDSSDDGVVLGEDTSGDPIAPAETADTGDEPQDRPDQSPAAMYDQDRVSPGDAPAPDTDTPVGGDDDTDESGGLSIEPGSDEQETIEGTFYVKYEQEQSVTLHDVDTGQICTLVENPGVERHDIMAGTLEAQPPMGVSYLFDELDDHYSIPVETSPEPPTKQVREMATAELESGQALPIEREGKGEIHILRVEPEKVTDAVEDLRDDETTYKNAARYDHVERVEIRTDEDEGIVSVRYLP